MAEYQDSLQSKEKGGIKIFILMQKFEVYVLSIISFMNP